MVLLRKVKLWVGPLWWYTAIFFCVQRLGDVANAFVGLYLIPKYVQQEELGAVLPLAQVGNTLGLPLTILMMTFTKFLNTYAMRDEYGKIKSILRDVFLFATVMFLATMLYARFFMPLVFERMRVVDGRLGLLIVAAGTLGALSTIFTSALQALKKFRLQAAIGLVAAPLRLVTLLVCLPIRALSGYFVGQLVPTLCGIGVAVVGLRNIFRRSIKAEPYLRQDGVDMVKYAIPVAIGLVAGTLQSLVESFVIRHRLPDFESAGYYMVSRFADMGAYVGSTLIFVLFPLASEQHERADRSQRLVVHGMGGSLAAGTLLAVGFWVAGRSLLGLAPTWRIYADLTPHMAVLTLINAFRITANCFAVHEMACRRFGFLYYAGIISVFEAIFLYCVTGYSFFEPWLPASWIAWMSGLHAARLEYIVGVMFVCSLLPLVFMSFHLMLQRRQRSRILVKGDSLWR